MADTSCLFSLLRTDFSQYDHRSITKPHVSVPSQRARARTHMFVKREINFMSNISYVSVYVRALNDVHTILKTDIIIRKVAPVNFCLSLRFFLSL